MEDLSEAIKVSWEAESGSALQSCQVTPPESPNSPQSDPYSPPAPFPPPPRGLIEEPHCSVQSPPAEANTALISLHIDGASNASDGSSGLNLVESELPEDQVLRIISRYTDAATSRQCILVTLVQGASYGLNFAFDKTGGIDLNSLGVHGVNFLRCNILRSPRIPDFDKMGLSSLFFVKSVDSQVARLRASTAEADETPIIFPAGFDNAAFSRSVRLNPNAPEKFELVRYDIMGTAKEFQNYKTGYGASKREREAWGALIKIFDPAHYTAPLAPELEHMAADFFGGNPVLEPGHYMARYFQDRLQNRNPSRIKSHVVTYHEIAMSDILRQEILKHDMQLSKFLFDTMQNARLQEYQEKSENKIINIRDMIFWTPASKNNYNADPISPGNVEAPTAPSSTAEASEIAFALVDEQTWINEPGIKSGDSTQVELVSAIPVSGKNAKKNAKKRKKAKSKAAQNNKNKGAGASSNTGVAKSYNLSETEWAQAPESIHIGATRQVDNSSLLKETAPYNQANILVGIATISGEEPTKLNHPGVTTKSITVDESLIATSFRVNKSAPTLKLSLIEPYLVDTQNFSRHSVGDASLSVTAGNNTTGELNAVDLADLGDLGSPSHSEFNYQDFNSLYDVSDSDHAAEWNVVQSKSSKKATKQNQSRKHSQPLGGNQLSSNDTSGDNTLRARHQHPQRHIHQRKTEPKLEPKSFKSNITDSFNLNIEEYPPLAPVVPSRALKKEEIFKEIKVAMKAVDGSKSKYEDKDDTGESKTGHKDGVKNDDVEYDAGKGNGGTNHTCKNKTNKYESDKNETEKSAVGMGNNGKDTAATSNAGGTKAGKNTQIDIKTDVVNKKAKNTGSVKSNSARSSGGKSDSPQAESSTHVDFTSSDPLSGPHAEDVCQSFSTQLTDGRSTFQDPDDSLLVEKNMLSAESTDTNDGGDGNSKFSDEFKVVVWTSEAVINLLLGPSQETRKVLTRFKSGSVSDLQRLIAEEDAEYDSEIEEDPSTLRSRAGSVADIYYTAQHDVLSGFHRAAQLNANQESRSAANITVGQQAITHDTYGQDINGQAQFFPNCMTEQYLVSNDNSDEQNVIQQFVSGPATEYSPVVAQSYHPGFNYAVAQSNGNQHTVSTIPHLYAQYPAISTTNPGHNTGLGTTLGDNAGGSSMQTTQQVQTLRSLPAAFAVCTYCMTLPSGGPESQVICPGCGPDHYVRYCSVACLLTDSLDHSLCCLRHPVPPRALDPKIPQEVCRSLTPLAPPLTASVETPERFRQRTFSMFCSSGPFPQILAAWARKMNINLHGVVNGTDWFKKAGDYAIFRSETTGLAGRYNPKADVIFTVILQVNDPRKQYLVRVLNACFIDPRIDLLVFLFRTILILLKDLDFYRLTKYYETREIVIQEFMFQFEREWGLTAAHWVPDTPFDIGLEWLYILKSLETVEYHNPILGQAWPTLYKS